LHQAFPVTVYQFGKEAVIFLLYSLYLVYPPNGSLIKMNLKTASEFFIEKHFNVSVKFFNRFQIILPLILPSRNAFRKK